MGWLEDSLGLSAEVGRVDLELLPGSIVFEGVELGSSKEPGPPWLTVRKLEADFLWRSLIDPRPQLPRLQAEGVRLDLAAPFPHFGESNPDGSGGGVDIGRIEIRDGEVTGAVPGEDSTWLRGWQAGAMELSGRYVADTLALEVSTRLGATARWAEQQEEERLEAGASASFELSSEGWTLEALTAQGEGVEIQGRVSGQLGSSPGLDAQLSGSFRPGRWQPGLQQVGPLSFEGEILLAGERVSADAWVEGQAVPGELADPWLAELGLERIRTEGTQLDVAADLEVELSLQEGGDPDRWVGDLSLLWRRGKTPLLRAESRTAELGSLDGLARIPLRVELKPGSEQSLQIEGAVVLPSLVAPSEARLEALRLQAHLVDSRAFFEDLWTLPAEVEAWLPGGQIAIDLRTEGELLRPRIEGELGWSLAGEQLLDVQLMASPGSESPGLEFSVRTLPPPRSGPTASGRLLWSEGELPRIQRTRLVLAEQELGALWRDVAQIWPRALPAAPSLGELLPMDRLATVPGLFEAELELDGELADPELAVQASWQPSVDGRIELTGRGHVGASPPFLAPGSKMSLVATGLELERWAELFPMESEQLSQLKGRLEGRLEIDRVADEERADFYFELRDLSVGDRPVFEWARAEGEWVAGRLVISELGGDFGPWNPSVEGGSFHGRAALDRILESPEGILDLRLQLPQMPVSSSWTRLELREGVVLLESGGEERDGRVRARLPLGSWLVAAEEGGKWPGPVEEGPIAFSANQLELSPWSVLLPEGWGNLQGQLTGEIVFDPTTPWDGEGYLEATGLALEGEEGLLEVEERIRLELAERRVTLLPARVVSKMKKYEILPVLEASGWISLRPRPSGEADWSQVVSDSELAIRGTAETSTFNRFLGGSVAAGPLQVNLHARGPLDRLVMDAELDGQQMSITFAQGSGLRLEAPKLRLASREGALRIEQASAELNRGSLNLTGQRSKAGHLQLESSIEGMQYRMESGLTLLLDADLRFDQAPKQPGRLSGAVLVDRGALRRNMYLDREILALLRSERAGVDADSDPTPFDDIALDLDVTTRNGLSLRNNLADLRLDWSLLRIRGTLGEFTVDGRLDADPGGWLEIFGQLLRVDELSVDLSADPDVPPRIQLETVSSLDDPTLYEQRRRGIWYSGMGAQGPQTDLFWRERQHGSDAELAWVSSGLATYFGDRVAGSVGRGFGALRFSVQPLPLFGETDNQGRLTLTQQLTPGISFIASSDTRQAEAQTYILQFEELLPRTSAQVFTTDDKAEGVAVQLTSAFGRGPRRDTEEPTLRRMRLSAPDSLNKRRILRSITYAKGDALPRGAELDVELAVAEEVLRQGFPGSSVRVELEPVGGELIDLRIAVEAGPRVGFEYVGLSVPSFDRELVESRYLPSELDGGASLQEVRSEAKRSLRRMGHFRAEVTVEELEVPDEPFEESRTVRLTLSSEGELPLVRVRFEGVSPEEASGIEAEYSNMRRRIELAEELPGADLLLLGLLDGMGYDQARIVHRVLSAAGDELVVTVEPGPRRRIEWIRVEGVPPEEAEGWLERLPFTIGDTLDRSALLAAARKLEGELEVEGFSEAQIGGEPEPAGEGVGLVVQIDRGPRVELREVRLEGLLNTREDWLRKVAGIQEEVPLEVGQIALWRRKMFETRLFEGISTKSEVLSSDGESSEVAMSYELEEGPRYLLSYGGRWESDRGASVVVDAVDRNLRGRGRTLGLRTLYGGEERRLRLYHGLPRVPFPAATLEMFLEGSVEDYEEKFEGERLELKNTEYSFRAQLTFPLGEKTTARPFLRFLERTVEGRSGFEIDEGFEEAISPVLGLQIAHDTRQQSLGGGLSQGMFVGVQVGFSSKLLGSDTFSHEVVGDWKYFLPVRALAGGNVIWAQRAKVGLQGADEGRVPFFDRFRLGGEYSVRGYPTESLGPQCSEAGLGESQLTICETEGSLGGEVMFLVNQELHFPLWRGVTGLAFFDAGNVWADLDSFDSEIFTSVGVGLRASAFRLDFAIPLDPRPDDPDYQLYFGFGNAF